MINLWNLQVFCLFYVSVLASPHSSLSLSASPSRSPLTVCSYFIQFFTISNPVWIIVSAQSFASRPGVWSLRHNETTSTCWCIRHSTMVPYTWLKYRIQIYRQRRRVSAETRSIHLLFFYYTGRSTNYWCIISLCYKIRSFPSIFINDLPKCEEIHDNLFAARKVEITNLVY